MSMVGADMLYKIHLRLSEIFQTQYQPEKLFGGITVILVGDLLQLPPVKENYIFQCPKNKHFEAYFNVNSIWHTFEPIILRHNHRQGEGKAWAQSLNNFRVGIVTAEDEACLRKRQVKDKLLDQNAIHVSFTNTEVDDHNTLMLDTLDSPPISFKAEKRFPKGFNSVITKYGTIDNTGFMDNLVVKINARAVMVKNVNTADGLVNGAAGTILAIETNKVSQHEAIIVKFDNETWGQEQRTRHSISEKYKKNLGTPIFRHDLEYDKFKGGKVVKPRIYQFPLRLNYASTVHRMQVQLNLLEII